jgi:hypothetical protein
MRRRQQDSNLRTARSRLRASNALPLPTRPCLHKAEGEGVEPPRPESPPVFETGYRASGSPSEGGSGRRRTCNPPLKRRQLCQLSYGAVSVTGRDRTCDAPRFRRALYRAELRSRVKMAEPESNRRPPPYQRGALPPELSASEWARLGSNQQPLVCKTSALPVELLALEWTGRESNPRTTALYGAAVLPNSQLSGP